MNREHFHIRRFFGHRANNVKISKNDKSGRREGQAKVSSGLPILSRAVKQQSLLSGSPKNNNSFVLKDSARSDQNTHVPAKPIEAPTKNVPILGDPAREVGGYKMSTQRPQAEIALNQAARLPTTPAQAALAKMTKIALSGNLGKPDVSLFSFDSQNTDAPIGVSLSTDARVKKLPADTAAFTTLHLLHKLGQEANIFALQKAAPDIQHDGTAEGQVLANIHQNIDAFTHLAKPGRSEELSRWLNEIYAVSFDLMVGDQKIHSSKPANVLGHISPDVAANVRDGVDKVEKGISSVEKSIKSAVNKVVPDLIPDSAGKYSSGLTDKTDHVAALPLARLQWAVSNMIDCIDGDVEAKTNLEAWRDQLHGEYIHQAADEVIDYLFDTTYKKFQKFGGLESQSITAKLGAEATFFDLLSLYAELTGTVRKQNQGDEERITVPFVFAGLQLDLGYRVGKDLKIGDIKLGVKHSGSVKPFGIQHSFQQYSTPTLGGSTGMAMWRMLKEEASRNLTLVAGQELSTSHMESRHLIGAVMDKVGLSINDEAYDQSISPEQKKATDDLGIKTIDYRQMRSIRPPKYNEIKQMDAILERAQNSAKIVAKSLHDDGVAVLDSKGESAIDPKDFDRGAYPSYKRLKDPFSVMPVWIKNYGLGGSLGASVPGVVSVEASLKDTEANVTATVLAPQSPTELMIGGANEGPNQQRHFFPERQAMVHNWVDAHPRLLSNIKDTAKTTDTGLTISDFSQSQCERVLQSIEKDVQGVTTAKKILLGQVQMDGAKALARAEKRQHLSDIKEIDKRWLPLLADLMKKLKPRQTDRDRKQAIAFTLAALSDRMRAVNQQACDSVIFSNVDKNLDFQFAEGQSWATTRSDHASWLLAQGRSPEEKRDGDAEQFNQAVKDFYKSGNDSGLNGLLKRDGMHRVVIREFNDSTLQQLQTLIAEKQRITETFGERNSGITVQPSSDRLTSINRKIQSIMSDEGNATYKPISFSISKEVEAQITSIAGEFWGRVTTEEQAEGLTAVDHDTRGAIATRLKAVDMNNDHMPWRKRDHEIGTTYDMKGESRFQGELKFKINDPVISADLNVSVPLGGDDRKLDLNIGLDIGNRHFLKQVNEWMWCEFLFVDLRLNAGIFALFDNAGGITPEAKNQLKQAIQGQIVGDSEDALELSEFNESFELSIHALGNMREEALSAAGINPELEGESLLKAIGAKAIKQTASDAATWSIGVKLDRGLPLQIRWTLSKPQYRFDPHNNISKDVAFENPRGTKNQSHFAFESVRVVTRNPLSEGSRRGMLGGISISPTRTVKRATLGNYIGPKIELAMTNTHRQTAVEYLSGRTWNPVHRDFFRHWGNRGDLAFRGSSIMMETPMEQALREKRPALEKLIANMANPCSDARAENAFIQQSARVAFKEIIADKKSKIALGEGVPALHRKVISDTRKKLAASEGREQQLQQAFEQISKDVSVMIEQDLQNPEYRNQYKKLQELASTIKEMQAKHNNDIKKLNRLTDECSYAQQKADLSGATDKDKANATSAQHALIQHRTAMNKSMDSHKELKAIRDYLTEFKPEQADAIFSDAMKDVEGFLNDSCEYALHKIIQYIRPLPYKGKDRSKESIAMNALSNFSNRVLGNSGRSSKAAEIPDNTSPKTEAGLYQTLDNIGNSIQARLEKFIAQQELNISNETKLMEQLIDRSLSREHVSQAHVELTADRKKLVSSTTAALRDLNIIEKLKNAGERAEQLIGNIQRGEGAEHIEELANLVTLMAQTSQRISPEYRQLLDGLLELEIPITMGGSAADEALSNIKQEIENELNNLVEMELILFNPNTLSAHAEAKKGADTAQKNLELLEKQQVQIMKGKELHNAIDKALSAVKLAEKHASIPDNISQMLSDNVDAYSAWRNKMPDNIKRLFPLATSEAQSGNKSPGDKSLGDNKIKADTATAAKAVNSQTILSPKFTSQLEKTLSKLTQQLQMARSEARKLDKNKAGYDELSPGSAKSRRRLPFERKSNDAIHKWENVTQLNKEVQAAKKAIALHRSITTDIAKQKKTLQQRFGQTDSYNRLERKRLIKLQENVREFNRNLAEIGVAGDVNKFPALRLNDFLQRSRNQLLPAERVV